MLETFITQTINLTLPLCSLVAGNWALLQIGKWHGYCHVLDLFCLHNIFAKPRPKMTTVSRFSRQNDVGLRAHNVALWENAVLVVALVPESKALCYWHRAGIIDSFGWGRLGKSNRSHRKNWHCGQTSEHAQCTPTRSPAAQISRAKI